MANPRELLKGRAPAVAPRLLGWRLQTHSADGVVCVELTELEAYDGPGDPASHAFRGETARNRVMFGPPGHLYVYFSYGMHWCANIVCGPDGTASAVLLRSGRVVDGVELARARRGGRVADRSLARGPATMTQALGIGRADLGADILRGGSRIELLPPEGASIAREVSSGPRVGVSAAADRPWRFWLSGDETVSAYKRSPRAPEPGGEGSRR
jgi:DNA-3-methyladenine glycosylase